MHVIQLTAKPSSAMATSSCVAKKQIFHHCCFHSMALSIYIYIYRSLSLSFYIYPCDLLTIYIVLLQQSKSQGQEDGWLDLTKKTNLTDRFDLIQGFMCAINSRRMHCNQKVILLDAVTVTVNQKLMVGYLFTHVIKLSLVISSRRWAGSWLMESLVWLIETFQGNFMLTCVYYYCLHLYFHFFAGCCTVVMFHCKFLLLFSLLEVALKPTITSLNLHCNQLSKIEGLTTAWQIRHLDLSSNHIARVEGLGALSSLRTLNLSCNSITKLEGKVQLELMSLCVRLYLSDWLDLSHILKCHI